MCQRRTRKGTQRRRVRLHSGLQLSRSASLRRGEHQRSGTKAVYAIAAHSDAAGAVAAKLYEAEAA
jgi:hypothetical protein